MLKALAGVRNAAVIVSVLGLGGCTVGYTADVHNDTAQPIGVAIIHGDSSGQSRSLAVQRIAPMSRGQVIRYGVPHDWTVYLEADAQGNPGYPAQLDLQTGLTVVRVTQDGNVPTGKLRIEKLER